MDIQINFVDGEVNSLIVKSDDVKLVVDKIIQTKDYYVNYNFTDIERTMEKNSFIELVKTDEAEQIIPDWTITVNRNLYMENDLDFLQIQTTI